MRNLNKELDKKSFRILAVDDENNFLTYYRNTLEPEGYHIDTAPDGAEAVKLMESEIYDIVFADLRMPRMDGLELLQFVKKNYPDTVFIMVTVEGKIDDAVQAMKSGADDYQAKPLERQRLLNIAKSFSQKLEMARELKLLKSEMQGRYGMDKIVARSKPMMKLYQIANKIADSEATVLIQGESGTGKELLAKAIHFNSPRKNAPLVAIDCASMPLELLQSELFGHIKGSFTGAFANRRGLFEEARGGTVFLDEIGDVPESLQLSLLRVLQERTIKPIGSDKILPIDVRIIAASNRSLKNAVEEGRFRKDLYYRLAVITLEIPPLRERREDIPTLINYFLKQYCEKNNKQLLNISPTAMSLLYAYRWEGNVRELENVIERAVVLADSEIITPDLLPPEISESAERTAFETKTLSLKHIASVASASLEKDAILKALKESGGNKLKAAEALGISRASLYNKLRSLGIRE